MSYIFRNIVLLCLFSVPLSNTTIHSCFHLLPFSPFAVTVPFQIHTPECQLHQITSIYICIQLHPTSYLGRCVGPLRNLQHLRLAFCESMPFEVWQRDFNSK